MRKWLAVPLLVVGLVVAFGASVPVAAGEPSTSPTPGSPGTAISGAELAAGPITFSEFAQGTAVTTQYSNIGIVFGGDSPFIQSDGCNPTSPGLSGTPIFQGAIEGTFVDPDDGVTQAFASSFQLDAGCFDAVASTRLSWFDADGILLGQQTNSVDNATYETFLVDNIAAPGAASWRIEIITGDPAGYEIDNVSFTLAENPLCNLELNQAVYTAGDMIIADVARLANPTPDLATVDVRVWFKHPNSGKELVLLEREVNLPSGFDQDFGPKTMRTVKISDPVGAFELNCRVQDSVSGETLHLDVNPFENQ